MWSLHDRLLLTVTTNNLPDKQEIITESWYGIFGKDCTSWRFYLKLININFDLSGFMEMWLSWHHISTCAKSLVSDVTIIERNGHYLQ